LISAYAWKKQPEMCLHFWNEMLGHQIQPSGLTYLLLLRALLRNGSYQDKVRDVVRMLQSDSRALDRQTTLRLKELANKYGEIVS